MRPTYKHADPKLFFCPHCLYFRLFFFYSSVHSKSVSLCKSQKGHEHNMSLHIVCLLLLNYISASWFQEKVSDKE